LQFQASTERSRGGSHLIQDMKRIRAYPLYLKNERSLARNVSGCCFK
jgi:hypothetical protein